VRKRQSGPSIAELRLRQELDQARRDLKKLKGEPVATPPPASAAAGEAPPPPVRPSEDVAQLQHRVAELERTRERLSRLYFSQRDETRRHAGRLHEILRMISEINANLDLSTLLDRIATTIQSSLAFRIVLIRVREPGAEELRPVAFAGLGPAPRAALESQRIMVDEFLSWLRDDMKVSRSYLIRHSHPFSGELPAGYVPDLGRREDWEWHAEDVLFVPLFDGGGELVGYFSVDDPGDRLIPSRETIELLEIFASHAVVAIENARLYEQLGQRTRELEEADQRMKEMARLKSHFVSTISHELRTPLTAIQAYAGTLLGTDVASLPQERLRHFLTVIDEEGKRLGRLIESVLDLNRFDSGAAGPQRREVDMRQALEESQWLLQRMAEAHQVVLKVESDVADNEVDADRDQIRQLILHLGSNAIKFTPAGGQVIMRLLGDEREIALQVEDTGIGIPESELDKIFDRFYQVDSSLARRYGGSGLGLAICKSIVEWHGGDIRAQSTEGRGSCFTVSLPRRSTPRVMLRPNSALSPTTRDVLRLAVDMVSEVMNAGVVSLMAKEKGGGLVIEAALGLEEAVVREARVRQGAGVSGWVAEHRRPVCVSRRDDASIEGSGHDTYRTGTFLSVPLESEEGLLGVLNVTDPASGRSFQLDDCTLLLSLAESISSAWNDALHVEAGQSQTAETADAFRRVLEHVRLRRHSAPDRVRLAQAIGQDLALPPGAVAAISLAAAVHDVGMTMVDRDILDGGQPLSDEDRTRMRRHVEMGAAVLDRMDAMDAVRDVVMSHHEWWDGSGYPRGLSGEEIPVGARVLAVVDAYESLTRGRAHRAPVSREAALEVMRAGGGSQFDPDLVASLERVLPNLRAVDHGAAQHNAQPAHEGR
jgi:signal transduction histidine kinase/response regulator RpfG family c-di-GMP phosphodiesterase